MQAQALHRAVTTPDYFGWLEHVKAAAGCVRPVRLVGTVDRVEAGTGRLLDQRRTDELPDGVVYKACGNRRASLCADCARTYQGDAFQVIRCGIIGGKTVPDTVARHPVLFTTFTAPSFGPVHNRTVTRHTCTERRRCDCRPQPCHVRRNTAPCPHGQPIACHTRHEPGDEQVGQPLCLDCYDHDHQVVWNLWSGELWRRTKQAIERHLATICRQRGIPPVQVATRNGRTRTVAPVRVSHGKVAEMQRRGAVHFHTLLRLDGIDPDNPDAVIPPPAGIGIDDLDTAIHTAVTQIAFTTPAHPDRRQGWPIAWGNQVDIRRVALTDGEVTDATVAGYLAKYATKSTEITGHCSTRLTTATINGYADPDGDHLARLIDACWRLGRPDPTTRPHQREQRQAAVDTETPTSAKPNPYTGLRRWAHMLGYGGHFLTKARRYSTTFRLLRDDRATYRRTEDHTEEIVVGAFTYAGSGWLTDGDALLANTAATTARERRRAARDETTGAAV
ncbi:replication initiator [Polymorphospora lycopeni]|uniref:Replication initiator n=1 Tax=Polymorphospora lycopeni TaxID=3140240 RepID=A0ABV5CSY3_9ACTN